MATVKVKVKKSVAEMVRWMNAEGGLTSELRLAAVAKPLSELDEQTALEVLGGLLEQEDPIDDPNVWVGEAAKALAAVEEAAEEGEEAAEEEGEAAEDAAPAQAAGGVPKKAAQASKLPATVMGTIKRLNASGSLWETLKINELTGPLLWLQKEDQERILKGLEERADSISNPTGWVINACKKRSGNTGPSKGDGKGKGAGKAKGKGKGKAAAMLALPAEAAGGRKPLTASEKKVLRTIKFINGSQELERPINYNYIKESLDLVDELTQLKILNRLKEKLVEGYEIHNPSTWITNACVRANARYEEMVKEKNKEKRKGQDGGEDEAKPKKKKKAAEAEPAEEAAAAEGAEDEGEWEE